MFIEKRIFVDGKTEAKLHDRVTKADEYAAYIGEYDGLEDWIARLKIELDDIIPLVLALNTGKWVDITKYMR
ncbi:MAG: hypothetical protein RSB98_04670 [Raoultibacter sp.]